ncbi:MAG: acyltransferase [Phycisphaerales bacterium]|nr:acyltransferase [Phycisphaerales bacterium]
MSQSTSNRIRKYLRLRNELSIGFYITDFFFRKILRQNSHVKWAIHHTSTIHCPEKIQCGINVFPGDSPGVYINAINGIRIGDYTNIGPQVGLISANHNLINNDAFDKALPIIIGKHCWMGKGVNILPEVVLGDFTIVGAGAVVTNSFPDGYCVIAGNPARLIKELNPTECIDFAKRKKQH